MVVLQAETGEAGRLAEPQLQPADVVPTQLPAHKQSGPQHKLDARRAGLLLMMRSLCFISAVTRQDGRQL